jgi:hypothetical protein
MQCHSIAEYTNRNSYSAGITNTLTAFTLPQPKQRVESTRKASSACEYTKRNDNYAAASDHYLLLMLVVLFQKLVNVTRALEDT